MEHGQHKSNFLTLKMPKGFSPQKNELMKLRKGMNPKMARSKQPKVVEGFAEGTEMMGQPTATVRPNPLRTRPERPDMSSGPHPRPKPYIGG